jgi:hypothetical protein
MSLVDDLLLLPDDQIDYEALDTSVLFQLATQNDEPFIATSALGELRRRRAQEAPNAAETILRSEESDRHIRAFAITTLCATDKQRAVEMMSTLVEHTNDPKVLGAMVECVLYDVDYFKTLPAQKFVKKLVERVLATPPDRFTDLEERDSFLETFKIMA